MKPLIIYHDNCADGFGAAFAAWTALGDEAEYYADQYGKQAAPWRQDENLDLREIYILDFSYPKEDMDYLFKVAKRVVWLDHHKTAFEAYGLTPNKSDETSVGVFGVLECLESKHCIHLDNNKSGAMLAWEYFHPNTEVPMLIKHIDDYDRWKFKLEGTKEFNKALWSYAPWSFEQWRDINLCVEENYLAVSESIADKYEYGRMLIEGAAILRAHEQNVRAIVEGASRSCVIERTYETSIFTDGELHGLAANCPPHLASDVGHQLANQSGTYGLLWHINKDGKCLCSLRSNGDYDVSTIAKAFGGGGHKNAAGFQVDIQTLLGWLK